MKDLLRSHHKNTLKSNFDALRIGLVSPETIRSWSWGQVTKPETINYRTLKPERDGLFCARIFGPIKDMECLCGKCNRQKQRGIRCDKCGVEVTYAKVRRERMGHIELAAPVAHIWFVKSLPARIALMLDIQLKQLEKVLYFERYIVTDPGLTQLNRYQLLSDEEYYNAVDEYGNDFAVGMGAESIQMLLKNIDIGLEIELLEEEIEKSASVAKNEKNVKRLKFLKAFQISGNKPEHMILTALPVLPPDLRPLVPLEGGRFASSDLNDLYRRVINRNNRLKRLMSQNAPDIIVRNEKRMLQEGVDALLDNVRGTAATNTITGRRPLKSLTGIIKGKQGRFRQNLLGKRVDYSGRSVIVVGPTLKLHECGLPKQMALELFKPFVYGEMIRRDPETATLRSVRRQVDARSSGIWDALEAVIHQHPVLLNRAPTLHRLGIQAFEPQLIEGKAIQLHPLVCAAFNADFDGDQMAVHVPLGIEAQLEARSLMMSSNNILSPANGEPVMVPSQDMILGLYYMTRKRIGALGSGRVFADGREVERAYATRQVHLHSAVKARITEVVANGTEEIEKRTIYDTTVGRVLLWNIVPRCPGMPFEMINRKMTRGFISDLIKASYRTAGHKRTVVFADQLMYMGFRYSTVSGSSIGVDDFEIPSDKIDIVSSAENEVKRIEKQYASGLLTHDEKYNKVIDIWSHASDRVASSMMKQISTAQFTDSKGQTVKDASFNSVFMYADSGARGSPAQIRQLAGMRGLMGKPDGSILETPITANFCEGLSVLQYFISTHGARKGLADTALKTANAGYLTRRLVDVAQDVVIRETDCGTCDGLTMESIIDGSDVKVPLTDRILGRVLAEEFSVPNSERKIEAGSLLDEKLVAEIENSGVETVKVRSPITCEARYGICAKCYGRDLATGRLVNIGEAVGIIAAQSVGEPGTQLTMRTFHIGGATSRSAEVSDIRVSRKGRVSLENIRTVVNSDNQLLVVSRSARLSVIDLETGKARERYRLPYGATLSVRHGDLCEADARVASWDPHSHLLIVTGYSGSSSGFGTTAASDQKQVAKYVVRYINIEEGITVKSNQDKYTGESYDVVMDMEDRPETGRTMRPAVQLNLAGEEHDHPLVYHLPPQSVLLLNDGDNASIGDVIARIPQRLEHSADITGGLPKVAELFEARRPQDPVVLAQIAGVVHLEEPTQSQYRVTIVPDDPDQDSIREHVPRRRSLSVIDGERVEKGDVLVEGSPDPHVILPVLGVEAVTRHLVSEIQSVYQLQGVKINDKHLEAIIRQMLRWATVIDPGSTGFIRGESVDYGSLREENKKQLQNDGKPATYQRELLSITRAALTTESFISAASFQHTTRVLTDATVTGKRDYMRGLKENVVVGRLIPAGTGLLFHKNLQQRSRSEKGILTSEGDGLNALTDDSVLDEPIL